MYTEPEFNFYILFILHAVNLVNWFKYASHRAPYNYLYKIDFKIPLQNTHYLGSLWSLLLYIDEYLWIKSSGYFYDRQINTIFFHDIIFTNILRKLISWKNMQEKSDELAQHCLMYIVEYFKKLFWYLILRCPFWKFEF